MTEAHSVGSLAVCRHCGKPVTLLAAGWADYDGSLVCVKSPTVIPFAGVLHTPMPDGLAGAAFPCASPLP